MEVSVPFWNSASKNTRTYYLQDAPSQMQASGYFTDTKADTVKYYYSRVE